jgi:hypothetical protein
MLSTAFLLAASMVVGQAEGPPVSPLPKEIMISYQYLMGTWATKAKVGEKSSEGTFICRWEPGRHCYRLTVSVLPSEPAEPVQHMSSIGGYDPVKKQTIEKAFWSDGSHYTLFYDNSNPVRQKGIITAELIGVEQGKEFKAKISVERRGPEEFIYRSQTVDGKPIEVLFRKIEGPKGPKAKPKQD